MDVGFQYRQISGPRISDDSFNQRDNKGGLSVGLVADILSCEKGKGVLITTSTYSSKQALDQALEKLLLKYNIA